MRIPFFGTFTGLNSTRRRFTLPGSPEDSHYENTPMQYTVILKVVKNEKFSVEKNDIFLIFAQNIDYRYTLETSTRSLCFGGKIRKIGIPLHTPVLLYKSGV